MIENYEVFKTKVNNMFVKYLYIFTLNNIDEIRHLLSDELYIKTKNIVDENINKNEQIVYDEINIKNSNIVKEYSDELYYYVEYNIESRYINYKISNGNIIGENNKSSFHNYKLILKKIKDIKENDEHRCSGCNRIIDVNNNGKCPYCGAIYELKNYDYILDSIVEC